MRSRAAAFVCVLVAGVVGGCALIVGDVQGFRSFDAGADDAGTRTDAARPDAHGGTDARTADAAHKDAHAADAGAPRDATTGDATADASTTDTGHASGDSGIPPSCSGSGPGISGCAGGSCCTSLALSGGTYDRVYGNTGAGPTDASAPASVSAFRLDELDVTVGRFRGFVAAWKDGYFPPAASGKHTHLNGGRGLSSGGSDAGLTYEFGWDPSNNGEVNPTDSALACDAEYSTWTPSPGANESLPINCINWLEAYAFRIWDGGFLPSEAEREYAAAGGSDQREYPWGTTAPGVANHFAIYGCYYPSGSGGCSGLFNIAPVGTATSGVGRWGQLDLAGEVYEWNLDWSAPYVEPCTDCAGLAAASDRVFRGGLYFYGTAPDLLPSMRFSADPTVKNANIGVRCARTP